MRCLPSSGLRIPVRKIWSPSRTPNRSCRLYRQEPSLLLLIGTPTREASSSAAAAAWRSEPEHAAKSPVDVVHEGCRRVAGSFFKVGLVERDEGGDVDD
jgi:hypothetical protein